MLGWATISLRKQLIEDVRDVLKSGRYRSISEFVSEAIRLRLEEISRNKGHTNLLEIPKVKVEKYANTPLDQLEQNWWVLVKLFEDLIRKSVDVSVEIPRELRNCRTLINFIRAHTCPECNKDTTDKKLEDLQLSLETIKHDLIAEALSVSKNYAKDWINKIDEAERDKFDTINYPAPKFVPGLPKDLDKGWMRLTLTKPVDKESALEISKQFGVITTFNNDFQMIVKGEKNLVRKAVQMIYRLQSEQADQRRNQVE